MALSAEGAISLGAVANLTVALIYAKGAVVIQRIKPKGDARETAYLLPLFGILFGELAFLHLFFAYVSFAHTRDLLSTSLGRETLLVIIVVLVLVAMRHFWERKHTGKGRGLGATAWMALVGAMLYGYALVTITGV